MNSNSDIALDCDELFEESGIPALNSMQVHPSVFEQHKKSVFVLEDEYVSIELEEYLESECKTWTHPAIQYLFSLQTAIPVHTVAQMNITGTMRAILCDWMMEVCEEFALKRETFHLAVSHLDRVSHDIQKNKYQLVGLAAMIIAAKTEEVAVPHMREWVKAVDNGYSLEELLATELLIMRELDWKLLPATPYNWVNCLMTLWDSFVQYHFCCVTYNRKSDFEHLPPELKSAEAKLYEKRMILFKEATQTAYRRYRETMQVLDVGVLHRDSVEIANERLALGLLYLMISRFFYQSGYALLHYEGPGANNSGDQEEDSQYENAAVVQDLFLDFISSTVGITDISEIYCSVHFFHPLTDLEVSFDLPIVCKVFSKQQIESSYNEFLAYQTHNKRNLDFFE